MAYLIGTDEAGYGPNLGPLVISATLWHVPDRLVQRDLYAILDHAVCAKVTPGRSSNNKLLVADSKAVFRNAGGWGGLESSVLTALAALDLRFEQWADIWPVVTPDSAVTMPTIPWYRDFAGSLPMASDAATIATQAAHFVAALRRADVRLSAIRSVAVFPSHFNQLVDRQGSKGAVLSEQTLRLVARLIDTLDDQPVFVQCDKHGGRNRYAAVLQHIFPDRLVQVLQESKDCSRYRGGSTQRPFEISFVAKGESLLPVALASMTSKYLRELAMTAFNAYWCARVPGIRPTAGYPLDARRFLADIAACRQQLGIADDLLWRKR